MFIWLDINQRFLFFDKKLIKSDLSVKEIMESTLKIQKFIEEINIYKIFAMYPVEFFYYTAINLIKDNLEYKRRLNKSTDAILAVTDAKLNKKSQLFYTKVNNWGF